MQDEDLSGVAETGYAYTGISSNKNTGERKKKSGEKKPLPIKKRKIKLGMFEGKFKMTPEELFYNDDLSDEFEDNLYLYAGITEV